MSRSYEILDEPHPGALSRFAVQPFWPLLAVMFGGAWLSWSWFVFNGYAVGSPTRRREAVIAACGFAGNLVLGLFLGSFLAAEVVSGEGAPYLVLILIVWKLGVSYWLYVLQARTFGLYEYFGGVVQNGLIVVVAGYFARRAVMAPLFEAAPVLALVMG